MMKPRINPYQVGYPAMKTLLVDLTLAVANINSYNRMNIAFQIPSGQYQPGDHKTF